MHDGLPGWVLLTAGDVWHAKLWLIDLAGSERLGKTEVDGQQLKEAQFINKSLSALGDCIHGLCTKSSHIPFRNSKLTYVLQVTHTPQRSHLSLHEQLPLDKWGRMTDNFNMTLSR